MENGQTMETGMSRRIVVDADGHVMEPEDLWLRFLEPKWRARAIRIETDNEGMENLLIDGKSHELVRGRLGILGGVGMQDDLDALLTPGKRTYQDGLVPGGHDPAERLKVLDAEGIDVVLLYPTLGIHWEGHVTDALLADAYTRAYNRYIVEFCSCDRKRLVPVAHVNLLDVDLAIAEAGRARKDGCVGIYLSPDPASRGGRWLADPELGRFWDAASDLDMPVGFHVVARENEANPLYPYLKNADPTQSGGLISTFLGLEVMMAFSQMLTDGVLARHPRLKLAVLETGSNWLVAWLDRMDHKFEKVVKGRPRASKLKPSEYFDRQCVISADPDETQTRAVIDRIGDDKLIWASDYPHIDAEMNVLASLEKQIGDLPQDSQDRILGGNCLRFYGLNS
jgi:predicted TIM-barrel fold metal-dependent hydrolase